MSHFSISRRSRIGASILALAALLAAGPSMVAQAQSGDVMVPKFEADPYWPKPLPNHWLMGNTIGLDVDKNDMSGLSTGHRPWNIWRPIAPAANPIAARRRRMFWPSTRPAM